MSTKLKKKQQMLSRKELKKLQREGWKIFSLNRPFTEDIVLFRRRRGRMWLVARHMNDAATRYATYYVRRYGLLEREVTRV